MANMIQSNRSATARTAHPWLQPRTRRASSSFFDAMSRMAAIALIASMALRRCLFAARRMRTPHWRPDCSVTGATATVLVSVTLTDVAEDGTITIAGEPKLGRELVPRLEEADGCYGQFPGNPESVLLNPDSTPATILWQWQVSMDNGTAWQDVSDGAQRNYVPYQCMPDFGCGC